jgi:hypothetical protein
MGRRGLIALAALVAAGCGGGGAGGATAAERPRPGLDALPDRVVWDFEHAVRDSQEAFLGLFDFTAVGEMEILLHRYDALGRLPGITEARVAEYLAEDGTPDPPERERTNVGGFYGWLIRPAIGGGGCAAVTPTWEYNQQLAGPYDPLPEGHEAYEPLRLKVNGYLEDGRGGVIGIRCPGGARGLALVYTRRDSERGYDLITIYDDGP